LSTIPYDSPDYTLLSDVNVVGSIAIDVNVVGSVTINVNVVNDRLNVYITNAFLDVKAEITNTSIDIRVIDSTVDLTIYTPEGRWIVASDLLATYAVTPYRTVSPGKEVTILSATGFRGRLRQIGGELVTAGSPFSIMGDVRVRIYIDNPYVPRIDLSLDEIDFLNGRAAYWLWTALDNALANNLSPPFNCAKYSTSPERWLIEPFFSNPTAAITMLVYDRGSRLLTRLGFYLRLEAEFMNSVEVRIYNGNTSNTLGVMMTGIMGEYVWP